MTGRRNRRPDAGLVFGLMSGTSGDGLDLAVVRFEKPPPVVPEPGELVAFHHFPYPPELAKLVRRAADAVHEEQAAGFRVDLERELYPFWRGAVQQVATVYRPVLMASHGQTLYHRPPVSLQWDRAEAWNRDLGLPVVTDLRRADLEAGGQGAPLAPLIHAARYACPQPVAVLNLGGIANLTLLPGIGNDRSTTDFIGWSGGIRGWDTGPGNLLLDQVARERIGRPFDPEGTTAATGRPDDDLVVRFLDHPYFRLAPPKSTGRDIFGGAWCRRFLDATAGLSAADALATAAELTVRPIADALEGELPAELIVVGGGARNRHLLHRLDALLPGCRVRAEIPAVADALEAWLVALIGWRTRHGLPSSIPSVTGAERAAVLGVLTG